MGWSCNADAARTLDRWTARCIESTGSSNIWESPNGRFFIELSREEHDDGAITGSVWRMVDEKRCQRVGSFRINGDGTVARGPSFLGR